MTLILQIYTDLLQLSGSNLENQRHQRLLKAKYDLFYGLLILPNHLFQIEPKKSMNKNIEKLYSIAQKPVRHIIGLMSGTSLDGLDVALCRLEGQGEDTKIELVNFETVDYSEAVKCEIREIFAKQTIEHDFVLFRKMGFKYRGCRFGRFARANRFSCT
jgi:Anhydro-N-acetylmuramic acid kinase